MVLGRGQHVTYSLVLEPSAWLVVYRFVLVQPFARESAFCPSGITKLRAVQWKSGSQVLEGHVKPCLQYSRKGKVEPVWLFLLKLPFCYLGHRRWMGGYLCFHSCLSVCLWAWYLKKLWSIETKLGGQLGCVTFDFGEDPDLNPDPIKKIWIWIQIKWVYFKIW